MHCQMTGRSFEIGDLVRVQDGSETPPSAEIIGLTVVQHKLLGLRWGTSLLVHVRLLDTTGREATCEPICLLPAEVPAGLREKTS